MKLSDAVAQERATTLVLTITFDRPLGNREAAAECFASQLTDVLTGKRNVPAADAWGYGRAIVARVDAA